MQNLAFTHANLFDGRSESVLQEDVTILVEREPRGNLTEGTITQIGPTGEIKIPSDSQVIDLSGPRKASCGSLCGC